MWGVVHQWGREEGCCSAWAELLQGAERACRLQFPIPRVCCLHVGASFQQSLETAQLGWAGSCAVLCACGQGTCSIPVCSWVSLVLSCPILLRVPSPAVAGGDLVPAGAGRGAWGGGGPDSKCHCLASKGRTESILLRCTGERCWLLH